MEQFISKNDIYKIEMARLKFLLDNKIDYENTLVYVIHYLRNLIKDGDNNDFDNNGKYLLYHLINYIEKQKYPNIHILTSYLDFIVNKMMYLEQPFWFIGVAFHLSKGPYHSYLYNHPKFMNTLKTIYHCFYDCMFVKNSIIEIYVSYLNNIPLRQNILLEYENIVYFFSPLIQNFEISKDMKYLDIMTILFEKIPKYNNGRITFNKISKELVK